MDERNGQVVALRAVTDDDSLILITSKGNLMRMALADLREIGRATQGVRLIRVEEDDRVVAVASVVTEKEERAIDGVENGAADRPEDQNDTNGQPAADEGPPAPEGEE